MQQDPRFGIASREAIFCILLTLANFMWWYGFAYGLGSGPAESFTFIFGLPAWFFMSCVAGLPLFGLLAWIMVRFTFTDMPLDPESPKDPRMNQ
jgi:uncharacterized membrane protein YhdT